MHLKLFVTASAFSLATLFSSLTLANEVGITSDLAKFEGTINGEKITIMRNQDTDNTINPDFAQTSRPCPPFCVQPFSLADGVETIGELELIDYLQQMSEGDESILLIDSRTADWVARGTIPGAVNIAWTRLNPAHGGDPISISEILMDEFDVVEADGLWDYSDAKTLVMFCNGLWCGQSPNNIKTLLRFGYPPHKLKWYRGGIQAWETLGMTLVKPESE